MTGLLGVAGTAFALTEEQEEQGMLKITKHQDVASESMSFVLEGRLAGLWVKELEACWYEYEIGVNQQRRTVIDLTGVTFIDAEGKALLRAMWHKGAELIAAGCCTRSIVEEITGKMDRNRSG